MKEKYMIYLNWRIKIESLGNIHPNLNCKLFELVWFVLFLFSMLWRQSNWLDNSYEPTFTRILTRNLLYLERKTRLHHRGQREGERRQQTSVWRKRRRLFKMQPIFCSSSKVHINSFKFSLFFSRFSFMFHMYVSLTGKSVICECFVLKPKILEQSMYLFGFSFKHQFSHFKVWVGFCL